MMSRFIAFSAAAVCAAATFVHAQEEPKLKVGDPAPKLSLERWVKGAEVKKFENDKVYVVEFWATWCPPCIKAIPHLSELQKKHRDDGLIVLGVASSQREDTDEGKLKAVKDFIRKNQSKINYTMAVDFDRSMSNDWMKPAGRGGIPCSFVVDKAGKVAWIGHPMNGLDEAVAKALKGGTARIDMPADSTVVSGEGWQIMQTSFFQQPQAEKPAKELNPGDRAPALSVEEWVKGEPRSSLERGKVHVVEFWATWCVPCVRAIPHLTELQEKHKKDGVSIIGVAASERGAVDEAEAKLEKLRSFVADREDEMGYAVAFDADRTMSKQWLNAAGLNTIPNSFIVDKEGRIAWIGSPTELDEPLAKVVEGTWDTEAFASEWRKRRSAEQRMTEGQAKLRAAMAAGDHDAALEAIDELSRIDERMKVQLAGPKFEILLVEKNDYNAAYAFADTAIETFAKDDAMTMNHIAWTIVDPANKDLQKRDLDIAMRAAKRADALTKGADGAVVDTLAKVYFDKGEIDKALELQEKAVDLSVGMPFEAEVKDRLREYRAAANKR